MQHGPPMHVLVTWGTKRGGTEGIGHILADTLKASGHSVTAASADKVGSLKDFDAVIVGGALYANRWPGNVRRFVARHVDALRKKPVWFFSSGPLDDSADRKDISPTAEVAVLAERVGAKGHVTFGGRLEANAKGFPASAMARKRAGDWRNPARIRDWASELAAVLPEAKPGTPIDHPAHSLGRLLAHALVGWAFCAAVMGLSLRLAGLTAALVIHAIAGPAFFVILARHYFSARGARDPLSTAIAWTATLLALDFAVVAAVILRSFQMFTSIPGTWLPLALIFLATWATGSILAMMPSPKPPETHGEAHGPLPLVRSVRR